MAESIYPDLAVFDEKSLATKSWKLIGAGGFGQVYKARHLQWGRDVAVKRLCLDDGTSSDKYLLREAELMRRAESPHVIQVRGVFKGSLPYVPGTHVCLVMELMERGSLASLQKKLNHTPLPWSLVFRVAHQVAQGMNHLHGLNPPIIHKDLKPDNVLLDTDLNAKITDFGLSKFVDCSTSANSKGAGTPSYMPPEALISLSYKATPTFDVYSYGILLCSIVKGKQPYDTSPSLIEFHVQRGQRPSLEVDPEQATGLEDLVKLTKRCWHQEPDKRPLFPECTAVTGALYEMHEPGIKDAVYQVVTELFPPSPPPSLQDQQESEMGARDRATIGDESLENWTELGSGAFGRVYKASHKDWDFDVAIKLLHFGSDILPTALGREAGYMDSAAFVPKVYAMYHGIPPVPKLGYVERHGIVMELMERGSLLSLRRDLSGPPPWALAFRLANQVAVAMNFLHSKKLPVVHSDLKPDNVLLGAYLNAKIVDFGLAQVSNSVQNTSYRGDEGGALFYTAPEAFQLMDYRPVRSYDIYSYGILLWTLLTGEEPYPLGVNRDVLIFRVIVGERPDLHKIDQSKADGLDELVDLMKRCWDKDPTKRPTFRECTEVTGRVFSKHKKGIKAAVNETMTKLDSVNRQECVPPAERPSQLNVPTETMASQETETLLSVRKEFIQRVSEPVLDGLLDTLLDEKVLIDEEMEEVRVEKGSKARARKLIDMVRKKGNEPSSKMIAALHEEDPTLHHQLGLDKP